MSAIQTIQAVVVDPSVPGRFAVRAVEAPVPAPGETLVRVAAISLNRGEVRRASGAEAGWRPGWDFAGVVTTAAADGSGPNAGSRVVGMLWSGAWAEQVAVPSHALAELPDAVSFAQAATLPVAGLTALYAFDRGGPLLGSRVLITGASGGVGLFACQLARLGGAAGIVGVLRNGAHADLVRQAGAHEVVVAEDTAPAQPFGPFDIILESVGGASLATALTQLAPGGTCVLFGQSSGDSTTFDAAQFFRTGGPTLYGFYVSHEVERHPAGQGLARLSRLVASGALTTSISVEAPWTSIGDVAQQLMDRRFPGKAVLHVAPL